MKPKKSGWQRKVDKGLIVLRRDELLLGKKLGLWASPAYAWIRINLLGKIPIGDELFPKLEEIQHRRFRILCRYR